MDLYFIVTFFYCYVCYVCCVTCLCCLSLLIKKISVLIQNDPKIDKSASCQNLMQAEVAVPLPVIRLQHCKFVEIHKMRGCSRGLICVQILV